MELPNNTILQEGKYKILRFISAGGFGYTYEAMDTVKGTRVAIKELFVQGLSDRDESTLIMSASSKNKSALLKKVKRKFLEEARTLRSMSHPNIVKVFCSFEENGTAYYVMDYIDGLSLYEIVKRKGPLSEDKAIEYITQIATALKYVHDKNRLHLDIKPGNIMIDKKDNAILIDFGVSKQYDEVNGENTSTVIGNSHGYSPIEQLGNNIKHFSPATDIYALGATLYKCVTGLNPPDATTVLTNGLSLPTKGLKAKTIKAIRHSMKPKVTDRPQSVGKFLKYFKETKRSKSNTFWIIGYCIFLVLPAYIIYNMFEPHIISSEATAILGSIYLAFTGGIVGFIAGRTEHEAGVKFNWKNTFLWTAYENTLLCFVIYLLLLWLLH